MKRLSGSRYKTRIERDAEGVLSDLPDIDHDHARTLMERGEYFSVPEGWPRNWQWIFAIKEAAAKIEGERQRIRTAEERIGGLLLSLGTFQEFFKRGDLWPGLQEYNVACLKGGFETSILKRTFKEKDKPK